MTKRIRLGSSVTVLSIDDPVRVFQQFSTVDALSGGRTEITAGRGSSIESFPLFGQSLDDYDELYAEKLDLLQRLNEQQVVTWHGRFRPALEAALVVPRPVNGTLPVWLGTGGNPVRRCQPGVHRRGRTTGEGPVVRTVDGDDEDDGVAAGLGSACSGRL